MAARQEQFEWWEPPPPPAPVTVLEVARVGIRAEHETAVHRRARSVWDSWSGCRETIQRWAER